MSLDNTDIRVDPWIEKRFPNGSGEEWQGLLRDVKSRGIVVDLLVTEDGLLLDGHRRLRAAMELGLAEVPVKQVAIEGGGGWAKTVAMAVNLFRRHLSAAERANLGSSLLRLERADARERQREAGKRGAQTAGKGRPKATGSARAGSRRQRDRASDHVAEAVDVSRKTLERVEAVKARDPVIAKEMLDGEISVAAAYEKIKASEAGKNGDSFSPAHVRIDDFIAVAGKYRTVYVDPPWSLRSLQGQVSTVGVAEKDLMGLPMGNLAHQDGCHFWIWAPWAAIRKGTIHRLLETWKLRWVGEFVWNNGASRTTEWLREESEVLILAVRGRIRLMHNGFQQILSFKRIENRRRPDDFYAIIEELGTGPRAEIFGTVPRPGWECLALGRRC